MTNMRMILADDEPIISNGITKLIDWDGLGIEIVGSFTDGKSALEGIIKLKPDIALLDISMPKLTGIDILKECNNLNITTKIIFISGFQEFEYAKAALTYGATAYLLKPVITEELLCAIEKCMEKQTSKKEYNPDDLVENKLDYSMLFEEETTYCPVYTEILYKKETEERMKKLIEFSTISFIEKYLHSNNKGIVFSKEKQNIIILKGIHNDEYPFYFEQFRAEVEKETRQKIVFIVGKQIKKMGEIPKAYEECLAKKEYVFFAEFLEKYVFYIDEKSNKRVSPERIENAANQLIESIFSKKSKSYQDEFNQYAKLLCTLVDGRKDDCYLYSLAKVLEEKLEKIGIKKKNIYIQEIIETSRLCQSYKELIYIFEDIFKQCVCDIENQVTNNEKHTFIKAKEYIDAHYMDNISLQIMADYIHMNPYYFSAFFKKIAGENFKDYVNRKRIEAAVVLLLSTRKKTYEIAMETGFSDARTFSEIFQKYYGETPNAYRKRIMK